MADIERLIKDFQDSVKEVVELFYKKYSRKDLLCAWHEGIYPQTGKIGPTAKYSFHGVGLAVELNDKTIDFDFGEDDRIDGFDTWRLWKFADSQTKYKKYYTKQFIETEILKLDQSKKIYKLPGEHNYYYS